MYTRKLYTTTSTTGNGIGQLIVPSRARLKKVRWSVNVDSITDGTIVRLELSYSASSEIALNGAQQCIDEVALYGNFVTSGLANLSINEDRDVDAPFNQGQILYLHGLFGGTLSVTTSVLCWFQ